MIIYLVAGLFTAVCLGIVFYSVYLLDRIHMLEYQNEQLMYELEQRKKDLLAYRCMYASAYDGFEAAK